MEWRQQAPRLTARKFQVDKTLPNLTPRLTIFRYLEILDCAYPSKYAFIIAKFLSSLLLTDLNLKLLKKLKKKNGIDYAKKGPAYFI